MAFGRLPTAPSPCPDQRGISPRRLTTHGPKDKSADHPRVPPSPILPPSADVNQPKCNNPAHFAGSYSLWDVYCRQSRPSCRLGRKSDLRSHRLPHRTVTAAPSLRMGRYKKRREKQRAAVVRRSPPYDEGPFGDKDHRTLSGWGCARCFFRRSGSCFDRFRGASVPAGLSFGQHRGLPAAPQRQKRQTRQERAPNPPNPPNPVHACGHLRT